MHAYPQFFPHRAPNDNLDTVALIAQGLGGGVEDVAGGSVSASQAAADRVSAGRTLLTLTEGAVTVADLRLAIGRWQAWFKARGLSKGDRVAVMLNNGGDHVALIYALIVSGLIWVPVNTKHRGPGLRYVVDHAKVQLLMAERDFADVVTAAEVPEGTAFYLEDVVPELDGSHTPSFVSVRHDDVLCVIYTSGTTGAPKGVAFTHRMMRVAGEAVLRVADVRSGDTLFLWEPLCHIGGAQMLLIPFMMDVSLFMVPRFSASRFWPQMAQAGATQLHYLGGILDILMQLPPEAGPLNGTLRVAWGAGVSASAWKRISERLGCPLRECYGMTECSSFATLNETDKAGSIGRALPWLTVHLLDENGHEVAVGETGEIVLSSPVEGVFLPYYIDNPAATAQAVRGGRLFTGDSARRDEAGDLVFVGRRTDSMRVRGENVSAWEVERAFAGHPAIRAVAAVGVSSEVGEQDILLYVQFEPEKSADWASLCQYAEDRLATYQRPRYFIEVAQFEMTPSERIRKHLLSRDVDSAWDARPLVRS